MSPKNNIPPHSSNDSNLLERFQSDYVYTGAPDFVHQAADWQQTAEALEYCNQK